MPMNEEASIVLVRFSSTLFYYMGGYKHWAKN